MTAAIDVLVLSPHLDDAVFSCGGALHEWSSSGKNVLVVTLFAGQGPEAPSAFAARLHSLWGFSDSAETARQRRAEDALALERLGVNHWLHGELQDAIYRRGSGGAWLYPDLDSLRGPSAAADAAPGELEGLLQELPAADRVVAPLGVGGHVDHLLAHRAARTVFSKGLVLYEDYPYAESTKSRLKAYPGLGWKSSTHSVSAESLEAKLAAAELYSSQLVGGLAHGGLRANLESFVRARGGERFWTRRSG